MRDFGLQIAVVDNGFVYIGYIHLEDGFFVIKNGYNVRRQGTTAGYGQLAMNGPTKDSGLDEVPLTLVPYSRLVHFIQCNPEKWDHKIENPGVN